MIELFGEGPGAHPAEWHYNRMNGGSPRRHGRGGRPSRVPARTGGHRRGARCGYFAGPGRGRGSATGRYCEAPSILRTIVCLHRRDRQLDWTRNADRSSGEAGPDCGRAPRTFSAISAPDIVARGGAIGRVFEYYWLSAPNHTYDVAGHGTGSRQAAAVSQWTSGHQIASLEHLRWGLYRFYVDSLLYFGNVRAAYRRLRDLTREELDQFFRAKRFDTDKMRARGPGLPLLPIPRDDRYLVAEYACKSFDTAAGRSRFAEAITGAYRAHVQQGGSPVVSVDELIQGRFVSETFRGAQQQFQLSADDIIADVVGNEDELRAKVTVLEGKFNSARAAALANTRRYLSMVEDLDVYVATSMRTREHFRRMASFCEDIFGDRQLADLNLRYFDPTLSAAEGHIDKGLIECLMVDSAKALVYYAGDRESLGKDFEAAMALSRGKPVIFFCDDAEKERMYREVHPLTRLIEFDTGVAIGAMVATSIDTVRALLTSLFHNSMEYDIVKTGTGALHLNERLTGCLVRLQTHDRLLQETFWNYYHHRGATI